MSSPPASGQWQTAGRARRTVWRRAAGWAQPLAHLLGSLCATTASVGPAARARTPDWQLILPPPPGGNRNLDAARVQLRTAAGTRPRSEAALQAVIVLVALAGTAHLPHVAQQAGCGMLVQFSSGGHSASVQSARGLLHGAQEPGLRTRGRRSRLRAPECAMPRSRPRAASRQASPLH